MKACGLAALKRRLSGAMPERYQHGTAVVLGVALLVSAALASNATLAFDGEPSARGTESSPLTAAPATTTTSVAADVDAALPSVLQAAHRVITLAPHITELVFAAGAGDKIVATVNSSNYPPEALNLPRVGDGLGINAEQMLALQPDLVVAWQNTLALQKLKPLLARLSIAVVHSAPRLLDDIPANIQQLGRLLGTQDKADAEAGELRRQLAALRDTYARRAPVSVFIEVGTGPLYTLGDDTLTNDAITTCGGVNVFHDSTLVAPAVTVENVLARNPDAIIIASAATDRVAQRADYWAGLHVSAAQHHHVYGIHPDMLLRPGPRLIQATHELCQYLDHARSPLN